MAFCARGCRWARVVSEVPLNRSRNEGVCGLLKGIGSSTTNSYLPGPALVNRHSFFALGLLDTSLLQVVVEALDPFNLDDRSIHLSSTRSGAVGQVGTKSPVLKHRRKMKSLSSDTLLVVVPMNERMDYGTSRRDVTVDDLWLWGP